MENSVDILIENLIQSGYSPQTINQHKMLIPLSGDRMMGKKLILAEIKDDVFFLASDSYVSKAFSSTTFTGLFSPVSFEDDIDLKIYKKDKLADFLIPNKKNIGIRLIDQNLTISTKLHFPKEIISEDMVFNFINLCSNKRTYSITIGDNNLSAFDFLSEKQLIGLVTDFWIYKKEDIEQLIKYGVRIIDDIKDRIQHQQIK